MSDRTKIKIGTYIREENGDFTPCPEQLAEVVMYFCPGCKAHHVLGVNSVNPKLKPQWAFNGNVKQPTLSPSILTGWGPRSDRPERCHHFVKNGQIHFLGDSTHELAGKTVEMENF